MPRSPLSFASTSAPVVKGRALSLATEPSTNSTINGRSPVIAAQSVARSASPRSVNGRDMSIKDGEIESELSELSELASTVHSASSVDFNELEDEIIVGVRTNSARKSCPLRPASGPEDETMADADDKPVASYYPKRKRASVFHDLSESKMGPLRSLSDERQPPAAVTRAKAPQTRTGRAKGVILGYWRDSPGPTEDLKHAVIGFIDIRERLRIRVQPTTIAGETISDEYPLPPGPSGCWVTVERIVFLKHLVGLNHLEVKEYVKIRADSLGTEETEAEQVAAKTAAVKEAMRRAKLNLTAENATNPPQIAYGVELPDHLQQSRDPKRRRRSGDFNRINTVSSNGPVINTPIRTAPGGPQPVRNAIYPLPGTRPTRILLGHWAKSDEPDPKNRHAVYGILGQNGMFHAKLVRETRDGRFVDGNFPTGAGALWIAYEEVAFEPHLRSLARNEVKEYCRVRQWQIDSGETAEEKIANETKAVYEAQARVAETSYKAPTPLSDAPALHRQPAAYVEETDRTGRLGFGGHELRQSHRVEATRGEARPARQAPIEVDTPQPPPVPRPAMSRIPQSNNALELTSALAEREITRVELAQERAHLLAANHERAAAAAAQAAAAAAAIPALAANGQQQLHERKEMQRLNKVWARQESLPMRARAEDAKMYSGVKYERKANGPFTGKLVSQGTIINIDGEDYVEYRVLTKPSFF